MLLYLEEVYQLLKESLEICPFNQNNNSPTKKHISRLKQLLDPEISSYLSEMGSLFFSSLMTAKIYIDNFEPNKTTKFILFKKYLPSAIINLSNDYEFWYTL